MNTTSADTMTRVAGLMMVISGSLNAAVALLWVLSLIWVCVGLLWLIPLAAAIVEVVTGLCMMILGRQGNWGGIVAVLSSSMAMTCFNPVSVLLDLASAGLCAGSALVPLRVGADDEGDREWR